MDKLRFFVVLTCVTSSTWASVIPTQKAAESQPNAEASENVSAVVPTQLNMPVEQTPVHMEVGISHDSLGNQNPLLTLTKARDPPNHKPNDVHSSKPNINSKPSKPQKNPSAISQKLDVAKSSSAPKPSSFPPRDKPSKPSGASNTQGGSGSVQKPEKPTASSHKPQQSHSGKTESKETQSESTDNVAPPKPEGNSNSVQENLPSVPEVNNLVEPSTDGEKNADRQSYDDISIFGLVQQLLPPVGVDVISEPIPFPSAHLDLTLNTNANVSINKDVEPEPTNVDAAIDKSPQSNADQIQNQLQAQMEQIQSQIQNQQQQTQAHLNQPQSAIVAAVTVDPTKIPAVVVEETSLEESEKPSNKLAGSADTKDFHKQIVSEGQHVVQVQNVAYTTHSIVTNDPSKFAQDSVKLELLKPINSLYANSKDKAQAMMESLVSKVSSSPTKETPGCKGKETINSDSKKPEELVYEVEEIVEIPGVVSVVPLQIPDTVDVSHLVQNPEIVSLANQMTVDQQFNKMPQLPPNIVKLISQLHSLTAQSKQGSNAPVQVPAADQISNEGIVTTPDNQPTNTAALAQAIADFVTAINAMVNNSSSRPTSFGGLQNNGSPYAGSIPGSYAVPVNYVYTYPQLIPYVAPYVLVNGVASPASDVATNLGTDVSEEFSPSPQTLSPDSDMFVEGVQGVSIVPLEEIEKQEKENHQSEKHHQEDHINNNIQIASKDKPGKPTFNNQSKPSSGNGRPQNSGTTGSQSSSLGLSPANSVQSVGTSANSNNKPQNSQNNNSGTLANSNNTPQNSQNNNGGSKPQQSGTANSLNTGDKPSQEEIRPPFSGKPPVATSNDKPQGSSLANNNPQSSSANSANRPVGVTGFVEPSFSFPSIIPQELPQQSNINPNGLVLSTMGQFLENESLQQQVVVDKEEVPANSVSDKPPPHVGGHPYVATHGHGTKPQVSNGSNKPRPGGHGYLIPPKSADNGVEEYIQPNNQIEDVVAALPAGNAQSPTTFEIVVNPEPEKDISIPEKNNQVHKNPVAEFSSQTKPTATNGWQLPKWSSFAHLYNKLFGTRQRAAETEEVSEIDSIADNCTPAPVPPRNKQDNRPLCGVNLSKEAYTCEKLCTDGGFNVGTCQNDDSCVCSYSELSEIGLRLEFYYDRNMTDWEDYYPSYDTCSRCSCSNQCTETGYFTGVCGNACYCGRPIQNGVPLELSTNADQIFE